MNIYAIKDNVQGKFLPPSVAESDAVILRDVKLAINSTNNSLLVKRPQDFTLYKIGSYDLDTASIVSSVEFLANCNDLVEDLEHGKA